MTATPPRFAAEGGRAGRDTRRDDTTQPEEVREGKGVLVLRYDMGRLSGEPDSFYFGHKLAINNGLVVDGSDLHCAGAESVELAPGGDSSPHETCFVVDTAEIGDQAMIGLGLGFWGPQVNRAGACGGGSGAPSGGAGPALFGAGPTWVPSGRGLRGDRFGRVSRASRAGPKAGSPQPPPDGRCGREARASRLSQGCRPSAGLGGAKGSGG